MAVVTAAERLELLAERAAYADERASLHREQVGADWCRVSRRELRQIAAVARREAGTVSVSREERVEIVTPHGRVEVIVPDRGREIRVDLRRYALARSSHDSAAPLESELLLRPEGS